MRKVLCDTCGKEFNEGDKLELVLVSPKYRAIFKIESWPSFGYVGDMCMCCKKAALKDTALLSMEAANQLRTGVWENDSNKAIKKGIYLPVLKALEIIK